MQLIINVPDTVATRVVNALAYTWGYDPAGGQTKAQFVKAHLIAWLKEQAVAAEARAAGLKVETAALAQAESDFQLT